jgi:hypothetical protein
MDSERKGARKNWPIRKRKWPWRKKINFSYEKYKI